MGRLRILAGRGGSTGRDLYGGVQLIVEGLARGDIEWAVLYGDGAWEEAAKVRAALGSRGLNHLVVDGVDSWESTVSGVALEDIASARASMLKASRAWEAPVRLDTKKKVTRRALLSRPHKAMSLYMDYPIATRPSACTAAAWCTACVEACGRGALAGKPPSLDPYQCDGCMACLASCPTAALTTPLLSLSSFRALLDSLPRGGPRVLVVVERRLLPLLRRYYRGPPAFIIPVEEGGSLHPRLVVEANMMGFLVYEASWGGEEGLRLEALDVDWSYSALVEVDAGSCTLCGACARQCPEGALRLEDQGVEYALVFDPLPCVGCGACEAACPEGALRLVRGRRARAGAVRLASSPVQACRSCGRPVAPVKLVERVKARLSRAGVGAWSWALELCPSCKARAAASSLLGGLLSRGEKERGRAV